MKDCRVINLPRRDGRFNTLIDEYFLNRNDLDFVVLFTEWQPTVSVGNSQSIEADINLTAVKKYGLDLVRRKSGGEGILVDGQYIVFSVIGKREYFPQDLTLLRRNFSESVAATLRQFKVPAKYHTPDNIIIENPFIQTLGNAAQIVKNHAIAVHGSVRYTLTDEYLERMLETLMINNISLKPYREDVRRVLGSVKEFTTTGKDEVKTAILQSLIELYGFRRYCPDSLSEREEKEIRAMLPHAVEDRPGCRSRGVCHLNLNGKCLIRVRGLEDSRGQR